MVSQIPGKGAMYVVGFTDSSGTPLSRHIMSAFRRRADAEFCEYTPSSAWH